MNEMTNDSIISLQSVSISRKDQKILHNLNIEIRRGEFVFFIGKVGSGKTSVLKTLNAELPLQEGKAMVAGYDLSALDEKRIPFLRRKIGVVFQDFQLLSDRSVYDNLAFVLQATGWKSKKDIDNRIIQVLSRVGLAGKIRKMPHELSGGEQQRVVIARAVLNEPELILADEPTGNLDPENAAEIMQLFEELHRNGRTIVMITHNYSLVRRYEARVYKFENNTVAELNQQEPVDIDALG